MTNPIYPAYGVDYADSAQLAGINDGEWFCQPLWRGYRAILTPDGAFWSPRGKRTSWRPSAVMTDSAVGAAGLVLDVTRLRGGKFKVNDVVLAKPTSARVSIAETFRLGMDAVRVLDAEDVNRQLSDWSGKTGCVGLILKHEAEVYPWLVRGCRKLARWVQLYRPIEAKRATRR